MDQPKKLFLVVWFALVIEATTWEWPGAGWHPTSKGGIPRNSVPFDLDMAVLTSRPTLLLLSLSLWMFLCLLKAVTCWELDGACAHMSVYFWHQFSLLFPSNLSGGNAKDERGQCILHRLAPLPSPASRACFLSGIPFLYFLSLIWLPLSLIQASVYTLLVLKSWSRLFKCSSHMLL